MFRVQLNVFIVQYIVYAALVYLAYCERLVWNQSFVSLTCLKCLFFYWFLLLDECNLLVDKQHAKVVIPFSMYTEHQCCWHSWQYRADCMPGGNTWRHREGRCSSMQSLPGWICLSTVTHIHHGFCLLFPHHTEIVVLCGVKREVYTEKRSFD